MPIPDASRLIVLLLLAVVCIALVSGYAAIISSARGGASEVRQAKSLEHWLPDWRRNMRGRRDAFAFGYSDEGIWQFDAPYQQNA